MNSQTDKKNFFLNANKSMIVMYRALDRNEFNRISYSNARDI